MDTDKTMVQEASEIYNEATRAAGVDEEMTEKIGELIGRNSHDYTQMAYLFEAEGKFLLKAAALALGRAANTQKEPVETTTT